MTGLVSAINNSLSSHVADTFNGLCAAGSIRVQQLHAKFQFHGKGEDLTSSLVFVEQKTITPGLKVLKLPACVKAGRHSGTVVSMCSKKDPWAGGSFHVAFA